MSRFNGWRRWTFALVVTWGAVFAISPRAEARSVDWVDGLLVDRLDDDTPDWMRPSSSVGGEELPSAPSLSLPSRVPAPRPTRSTASTPASPFGPETIRLQRSAEQAVHRGDAADALRIYRQLLRQHPDHMPFRVRKAILATMAEQYAVADPLFGQVIEAFPAVANYWAAWAGVLIRLQAWERAGAAAQQALELDPQHLMARYHQLILDFQAGRAPDEEFWRMRSLRDLADLASQVLVDHEFVRSELGALAYTDWIEHALGPFEAGDLPHIQRLLAAATTHIAMGEWVEADRAIAALSEAGMTKPMLRWERIWLRLSAGQSERAMHEARILHRATEAPSPEEVYAFAYMMIKGGDYAAALAELGPWRRYNPNYPQLNFAWICASAGMQQLDGIWPLLRRLRDEHPEQLAGWLSGNTSYLFAIRGDSRFAEFEGLLQPPN